MPASIGPEPARDPRVRLPHEEDEEVEPPTSAHVEAVYRLLSPSPTGCRSSGSTGQALSSPRSRTFSSATTTSPPAAFGFRKATTKTRKALWVELPDALAEGIEATLPPREDRDPDAPLFPGVARRCPANGHRASVQGLRHPGLHTARPTPPEDQPPPPARAKLGGDRPLRRPAEATRSRPTPTRT